MVSPVPGDGGGGGDGSSGSERYVGSLKKNGCGLSFYLFYIMKGIGS